MKFKLLFFAVFLALASCSGDDNDQNAPNGTDLKEIHLFYVQDGIPDELRTIMKFQDNKLIEHHIFNRDGEVIYEDYSTYDNNGRLVACHITSGQDINDTYNQTLEYDDAGRLSLIKDTYNTHYTEERFDYTIADKIIKTTSYYYNDRDDVYSFQQFYDLLPDGRVYRITFVGTMNEIEYEGDNIASRTETNLATGESVIYNYTYDEQTVVKGHYLDYMSNIYGDNKANYIIKSVPFLSIAAKNKYLISGDGYTMGYEFNSNGYPVKNSYYMGGVLQYMYEITYQ